MGGTWMLAKTCKPKGVPISNLTLLFLETILSSIAQTAPKRYHQLSLHLRHGSWVSTALNQHPWHNLLCFEKHLNLLALS